MPQSIETKGGPKASVVYKVPRECISDKWIEKRCASGVQKEQWFISIAFTLNKQGFCFPEDRPG